MASKAPSPESVQQANAMLQAPAQVKIAPPATHLTPQPSFSPLPLLPISPTLTNSPTHMSQDHRIVSYRDLTLAMRRAILDNMMKAQSNMWRVLHEEVQEEERSTKMECALDEILQLAEETRRAAQFWIDGLEDLKEEPRELKVEETEEVDTREKQGDEGSITEKLPGLVVQSTSES